MLAKVYSAAVYGVDAYEVEIEVNASTGAPMIVVVGLPDVAVKESGIALLLLLPTAATGGRPSISPRRM